MSAILALLSSSFVRALKDNPMGAVVVVSLAGYAFAAFVLYVALFKLLP
jgi:hypothetical protein